jgi:hypothetical protein
MHEDALCLFCGEPEALAIQEIWQDGNFQLRTCCPGLLEHVAAGFEDDPEWGRALPRHLGAEDVTGHTLRRVSDGQGNGPVLDHQLRVAAVSFATARAFIVLHHRQCGPPRGWRYGASIWNGHAMMGVVTVGNPVAPALNGRGIVEVNRLCIRGDLHPMLRWNCCSMLYAHSAREVERRGFSRIITYIRDDEEGISLRAAGWVCEARIEGRGWHSARRFRSNRNAWIGKQRWSRTLRPKPAATPRLTARVCTGRDWAALCSIHHSH